MMQIIQPQKIKRSCSIAIVVSEFNKEITEKLYQGATERLIELGVSSEYIKVIWVPGAIEIPLAAQSLAKTEMIDAIICLGTVIRGETNHYDYVCEQVSNGCQHVALTYDLPVAFGVLTTDNEEQALARAGGEHGNKGKEAADVAVHMVSILRQIAD